MISFVLDGAAAAAAVVDRLHVRHRAQPRRLESIVTSRSPPPTTAWTPTSAPPAASPTA